MRDQTSILPGSHQHKDTRGPLLCRSEAKLDVRPIGVVPLLGSSTSRAADPELRFLNRTLSRIDGWFSFATGVLAVETSHLIQAAAVAPLPRSLSRQASVTA